VRIFVRISILLAAANTAVVAQCSDAGVCTIGSKHTSLSHQVGVSYVFGASGKTDDLTFHSVVMEGTVQLFEDARVVVSLPWTRVSGPLGNTSGIGDVTVLLNQRLWQDHASLLSVQIGGKLATGEDNAGSLPQSYQAGLGTNDLLLGVAYEFDGWTAAVGYQLSRARSENALTRLKRGDDLLLRLSYGGMLGDVNASAQMLAIKRLQESSVLNSAIPGGDAFVTVPESDQFQVNLLGQASLPLFENSSLQVLAAVPLLNRDVNVDGLKRTLTLSAGLWFTL